MLWISLLIIITIFLIYIVSSAAMHDSRGFISLHVFWINWWEANWWQTLSSSGSAWRFSLSSCLFCTVLVDWAQRRDSCLLLIALVLLLISTITGWDFGVIGFPNMSKFILRSWPVYILKLSLFTCIRQCLMAHAWVRILFLLFWCTSCCAIWSCVVMAWRSCLRNWWVNWGNTCVSF